ncbi:MAG: flagellar motor protein MotB [Vicinamibacterales bacterium]
MAKTDPVIIIKKKGKGHGGHHGGAWKVAYADFVTAMMAFFLVMWILGQSKETRAAIGGYFRDPGIFEQMASNGPIAGGDAGLDPGAAPQVAPESPEALKELLEQTAAHIREALAARPALKALADQIEIQITSEGMRIELVESSKINFFDSGSAELRAESEQILAVIATELGKLGKPVIIEGHTDNRRFTSATNYTNWELSTDRANSARRVMLGHGLAAGQVDGVRGYADTRPRVQDPGDPRNRRVSIVVRTFDERDLAALAAAEAPGGR